MPNPDQINTDGDALGNACDPDDDNDTVSDGSDNCPLVANPTQANHDSDSEGDACDADDDNDGFADDKELHIGTDPLDACPDGPSDDAWPLDIDMDTFISVTGDVLNFRGRIGETGGPPPSASWWVRVDLNMDNFITVAGDVLIYRGMLGQTCT